MAPSPDTDICMEVDEKGIVDIAVEGEGGDLRVVKGKDNIRQALTLRLVVGRGEIEALGHARYGSRVRDLIGEPLDRTNLELLRRYVRQALKEDPRVEDVTRVIVRPRGDAPGIIDVDAVVKVITGDPVELGLALDLG